MSPPTMPLCPTCGGRGVTLVKVSVRYKDEYRLAPCTDCNGSGCVSAVRLECIIRRLRDDKIEMDCRIEEKKNR